MNTSDTFPIRRLPAIFRLTIIVAVLMTALSLAGLIFPAAFYPTADLRNSFMPTDMVNLVIGLPGLVGAMALARRGDLIGLLFWPGALLYITYNYIAYAVAMPLTPQFAIYLALLVLSGFCIFRLISAIDAPGVQQRIAGAVPERFSGGVLAGFGVLFFLRSIGQVVSAITGQASPSGPELAVLVADFLIMPCWVVGGILLWQRKALGYVSGAGLLFQASMLFIGLLAFFILQPFLTATPFPVVDFVVIFMMGLVCFIPFALFARGILKRA